jgi:hypothetical protein
VRLVRVSVVMGIAVALIIVVAVVTGPSRRPLVTYYGAAGTFGQLHGNSRLPTGERLRLEAVPDWGFRPGQAAYFATVTSDGSVVMANEPQTDNQVLPTADEMAISVFDPSRKRFTNVVIPTSSGSTWASALGRGPGQDVGGADVADVATVNVDGVEQVAFSSAVPYHGWNVEALGRYPTFGRLSPSPDGWRVDNEALRWADTLDRSSRPTVAGDACTSTPTPQGGEEAFCRGLSELAVLPRSGNIVATQYFDDPRAGQTSGRIAVLSPTGQMLLSWPYPNIVTVSGPRSVHPRDIAADPSAPFGDERFSVVFDVLAPDGQGRMVNDAFPLQEFAYDARTNALRAVSAPVISGPLAGSSTVGFELVAYDATGNLWAAQSRAESLLGGPLVAYLAGKGRSRLSKGDCAAQSEWPTRQWSQACQPDVTIPEADGLGVPRSLDPDPESETVALTTMSGRILPVIHDRSASPRYRAGRAVDLGLDSLVDRNRFPVLPRKGALDAKRRTLWLPIGQLQSTATCAVSPCPPKRLDQWLVAVDLGGLVRTSP